MTTAVLDLEKIPQLPADPVSVASQVDVASDVWLAGNARRTDRQFAILMIFQWLASIALALWFTPRTWIGTTGSPSPHLVFAICFGGIISVPPMLMAWKMPGRRLTRHVIAVGQMSMSTLLIHLAGGRIEMHFHIFGSLAFLAFYLDWTVLVTASLVVLLDHGLGNFFWPDLVFGPGNPESWRWLEHAGWVLFCDIFLISSCVARVRSIRVIARQSVDQAILLRQAYTDSLTGLPNRLRFQKDLEIALHQAKAQGPDFALLYVDLDRFKEVNDSYGHTIGDHVLAAVAERLLQEAAGGTYFARIGGDEFVSICARTSSGLEPIAERAGEILRRLLLPIDVDGLAIQIGASIGISLYPEDGASEDQLLARADQAMYTMKRKGRRGFVFSGGIMESRAENHSAGEERLKRAIESKEFAIYYQPLLNRNGGLDGLEALARWPAPGGGFVCSPSEFIALAEETGLIVELGRLVLDQVCEQVAAWHTCGVDFGEVAINLSPRQLEQGDFPAILDETLKRFGVHPEWITFEITESAYVPDDRVLEAGLEALRTRGIKVSIDDFGTGYSSLGRLQTLSFNTLKIDQIFISGLGQSEAALGMVRAIINLAHLLGMSVVGEGVENSRQARILRELGCDQLQGHYFSRALPVEAIEEFILQHSAQAERRAAGVYQNGLRSADPGQIERRAVATGVAEMIVAFKAGQRDMAIWPAGRV